MKQITALILFCLANYTAAAQHQQKPRYAILKEYEGLYEYSNQSTLKIAASPKDTTLYAIINQSRYPLKFEGKDVFLNGSNDKVLFLRNAMGAISGYAVAKDTFALLSKKVSYPEAMWYPRKKAEGSSYSYMYVKPGEDADGLSTGTLKGTGLDNQLLTQMIEKIVNGDYLNVHSVLIASGGKLVFEEYFYEYGKDSLHEMRSATKSAVSALVGIAISNGQIKSEKAPVLAYFPEYGITDPQKEKITIEHMLENRSGLDCDISNSNSAGNETKMNYSDDWIKFTLSLPMSGLPGGKGMYCSGNPVTLCRIVEKASGSTLPAFAEKHLFAPLGIKKFRWNFSPTKENAEDFCQLYLSPRSMLKFGLLYLQSGKWNGKQVVPADWVAKSVQKHAVIQGVDYGYLWWLKYFNARGARYNGIGAQGNGGQRIYLFPAQDMVVVITGGNYNSQSPSDTLIANYILPAFNKKK